MTRKSPTNPTPNIIVAPAETPSAIFDSDDFIIPSLVEARLKNIPLSQEEKGWLAVIEQDENLREEYEGLLRVMQAVTSTPEQQASIIYLYTDKQAGGLYSASAEQSQKRQRLVENGLELTGASLEAPLSANGQVALTELGLVLDFSSPSLVRLRLLKPEPSLDAVAETAQSYQTHLGSSPDWTAWRLYADNGGKSLELVFDLHGSVQLPAELANVQGWRLIRVT